MLSSFFPTNSGSDKPWRRRGVITLALLAVTASGACGQDGIPLFPNGEGGDGGGSPAPSTTSGGGSTSSSSPSSTSASGSGTSSASGSGSSSAASSTSSSSSSGGHIPEGDPLTILNWNTHDFFDTIGTPGTDAQTEADYAVKRQTVGAAVKALNPDIAILIEVESRDVLDDINAKELGGAYVASWMFDTGDIREIGMLAKIMPDKVISHRFDKFFKEGTTVPQYTYTRDCLEAHFTFNGHKVIVLGVHFKSKFPPDDADRRLAEAQHTRAIANDLILQEPGAGVVILGDFNDSPGSPAYLATQGTAPNLFANAADAVTPSLRYSFVFQGNHELIDQQMISPVMAAALDPTSVVLKHGAGFDNGGFSSDHTPLMATYRFK